MDRCEALKHFHCGSRKSDPYDTQENAQYKSKVSYMSIATGGTQSCFPFISGRVIGFFSAERPAHFDRPHHVALTRERRHHSRSVVGRGFRCAILPSRYSDKIANNMGSVGDAMSP